MRSTLDVMDLKLTVGKVAWGRRWRLRNAPRHPGTAARQPKIYTHKKEEERKWQGFLHLDYWLEEPQNRTHPPEMDLSNRYLRWMVFAQGVYRRSNARCPPQRAMILSSYSSAVRTTARTELLISSLLAVFPTMVCSKKISFS